VTWEAAIFWVAVLSVVATLAYRETEGGRQRRSQAIRQKSGEERLRRAWEELVLRHDLMVSFERAIIEYREPNRGWQ
jgi:membrane protein required for beta-lactamase induction